MNSAEKRLVWLERFKESEADKLEMKVTKETINGNSATLEGTAKSKEGWLLKGKVILIKEDGRWGIEHQIRGT